MEKYIFVSYNISDIEFALAVRKTINDRGMKVVMAKYDISYDKNYSKYVDIAIKNCECFLFFLNALSQDSGLVKEEINLALKYKKKIIPICVEGFKMNSTSMLILKNIDIISVTSIASMQINLNRVINDVTPIMGKNSLSIDWLNSHNNKHNTVTYIESYCPNCKQTMKVENYGTYGKCMECEKVFLLEKYQKISKDTTIFCPHCGEKVGVDLKKKYNQCTSCSYYILDEDIKKMISIFG